MKLANVVKILKAVEAKVGVAKAQLSEVRRRRETFLDYARRAEAEALTVFDNAVDAADLTMAERHAIALERAAKQFRAEAEALNPEMEARRAELRDALREEIAWRRIRRTLTAKERARRDAFDEERRETTTLIARR